MIVMQLDSWKHVSSFVTRSRCTSWRWGFIVLGFFRSPGGRLGLRGGNIWVASARLSLILGPMDVYFTQTDYHSAGGTAGFSHHLPSTISGGRLVLLGSVSSLFGGHVPLFNEESAGRSTMR